MFSIVVWTLEVQLLPFSHLKLPSLIQPMEACLVIDERDIPLGHIVVYSGASEQIKSGQCELHFSVVQEVHSQHALSHVIAFVGMPKDH
jgi:hypothetical protein